MEQTIIILLIINIAPSILLPWTWHFDDDMGRFNKYSYERYNIRKQLDGRSYRILEKSNRNIDSSIVGLNEEILYNELKAKGGISNNVKWGKIKFKDSNGSTTKRDQQNKQTMKNKYCIYETKKYSRMERKIFKEQDYMDFLENNKTISDKIYRKVIFKKYRLRIFLPLLLFSLLFISLLLDVFCDCGLRRGFYSVMKVLSGSKWTQSLRPALMNEHFKWFFQSMGEVAIETTADKHLYTPTFFRMIIYIIPFLIFGVIIILGIIYYHKKVKKYKKIKFKKR
ncbi:fam-l protein [Plasmodium malariae]|uniref:Fam-l protein n=1 Tax=Plasmodium malariae TaxID=5858 RepID=A0A1D3JK32_PLAMA|nr:fam-l protein [Plasmodium malariae]SBT86814.1 fam-l protein [Plasmodium malariae]